MLIIGSGRLVLITGTSGQHNRPGRPYNRPLAVSSVIVKVATYQFGSRQWRQREFKVGGDEAPKGPSPAPRERGLEGANFFVISKWHILVIAKFKGFLYPKAVTFTLKNLNRPRYSHSVPFVTQFLPARRYASACRLIAIATCLSVRLSVRHAPVLCQNEES